MKRLWFEWVGVLVYMAVITRVAAEVVQATLDASGVDFAPELYSRGAGNSGCQRRGFRSGAVLRPVCLRESRRAELKPFF